MLLKKIFVWRKKVYKKFSWKKKFHLNTTTWDGIFVMNKNLANEEPTTNRQKTYIYTNKFQCFLTSAIWPWELNLLYCYYPLYKIWCELIWWYTTTTPRKIFIFPKKFWNLQERKKRKFNFRECFASFFCWKKKEQKILLCRMMRLNELTGIF